MKLRSQAAETEELTLSTLSVAERNAFPNVRRLTYGTLILTIPAFEYGFSFLDLHRNLWAHGIFYVLLLALSREFLIRKTPKIPEESAFPLLTQTLLSQERFAYISLALICAVFIQIRHTALIFPIAAFLFAGLFFSSRKFSSPKDHFIAYAQLLIGIVSMEVLPKSGGMDWLPVFTTLLAISFYVSALLK